MSTMYVPESVCWRSPTRAQLVLQSFNGVLKLQKSQLWLQHSQTITITAHLCPPSPYISSGLSTCWERVLDRTSRPRTRGGWDGQRRSQSKIDESKRNRRRKINRCRRRRESSASDRSKVRKNHLSSIGDGASKYRVFRRSQWLLSFIWPLGKVEKRIQYCQVFYSHLSVC
jgi:hypothetical protein